ncbi:MAG: DUF1501 domain-containing protein [Pirellulales bacterium]
MLTLLGQRQRFGGKCTRRDVLRVGTLGMGGLTLANMLRLRAAAGATAPPPRSVIMIWLRGGPSHIDSFDMKPLAPAEIRGEFRPLATRVPGIDICEYLPKHAEMMDRLAIVRGIRSNDLGDHTPHYILTGFADRGKRPTLGAIVSYLRPGKRELPVYVSRMYRPDHESSTYTGAAHQPFVPEGDGLKNLSLERETTLDRLDRRHDLLANLDAFRRRADNARSFGGLDAFQEQALDIITSPKARDAFDVEQESAATRERYGEYSRDMLLARRLVEAGVSVVTLKIGDWDTHEHNFRDMRDQLPKLDQGFHALISDLYDRGLERDVAVVMWGEFGRAPRISRIAGRDHWPEAGAAVLAGGGFRTGQVIGETDSVAGQSKSKPYTPSNILENLYRHLGIDSSLTIPDTSGRPMYVLDERRPVSELL